MIHDSWYMTTKWYDGRGPGVGLCPVGTRGSLANFARKVVGGRPLPKCQSKITFQPGILFFFITTDPKISDRDLFKNALKSIVAP